MSELVNVECTAIPDGVHGTPESPVLRLSVILRPEPSTDGSGVALLDWPSEIPKLKFDVAFGSDVASLETLDQQPVPEFAPQGFGPDIAMRAEAAAKTWWQEKLWPDPAVRAAYLHLMGDQEARAPADVEIYSYSHLEELTKGIVRSDLEAAIAASFLEGADLKALNLPPKAVARLADPNSPALRLSDAISLSSRPVFMGRLGGDAVTSVMADTGPSHAVLYESLQARYTEGREAIVSAFNAPSGLSPVARHTGVPWNPFAPVGSPDVDGDAKVENLAQTTQRLAQRFDDSLLGPEPMPPQPGPRYGVLTAPQDTMAKGMTPASVPDHALALLAFNRAMAPDEALIAGADAPEHTTDPEETPAELALRLARERVERTLGTLNAHPTLRKFVRLIVDIPIPLDTLPEALRQGRGVVSVSVAETATARRTSATAFVLKVPGGDSPALFEPCPAYEFNGQGNPSLAPSLPLKDGVVQLNIGRGGALDGAPRFRLVAGDAIAAIMALEHGLEGSQRLQREGGRPDKTMSNEPGLRTRGVSLLDVEANVPVQVEELLDARGSLPEGEIHLLTAENLVDAYALDIIDPKGGVHPAGARQLRYNIIDDLFPGPGPKPVLFPDVESRNEGHVSPVYRHWTEVKTCREVIMTAESLVCWTGANIGWPEHWRLAPSEPKPDPHNELGLVVTWDVDSSTKGPIQRFGGEYRVMLRARKTNGSTVSRKYSNTLVAEHALGDPTTGGGLVFSPLERAPAPTVLVPDGERLTAGVSEDEPTAQVILVGANATRAWRVFVSPKTGFDLAEQQGQFDPKRTSPAEPLESALRRAATAAEEGTYRQIDRLPDGGFPPFPSQSAETKAGALHFRLKGPTAGPASSTYYVDASLRVLGMKLIATKATPARGVAVSTPEEEVAFWRPSARDRGKDYEGFSQGGMRPVLLEVVTATSGASRIVNRPDTRFTGDGQSIDMQTVRVEIAPAHTCELEVWLTRSPTTALTHPLLPRALKRAAQMAKSFADTAHTALKRRLPVSFAELAGVWLPITRRTRFAALHDVVRFRLEHIVPTPLRPPVFVPGGGFTRAVDRVGWAKLADDHLRADRPSAIPRGKDQQSGEAIYAWGQVRVDRMSTGAVWAECIWKECDPALVLVRTGEPDEPWEVEQRGLWSLKEVVGRGRMFTLDPIAESAGASSTDRDLVNLAFDELGRLRALSADFRNSRARRVLIRLVGRSRFAGAYPLGVGGEHDVSNVDSGDFEAALSGGPLPSGVTEAWLLATRRPAAPTLVSTHGILYQRRFGAAAYPMPRGHAGTTLTHTYRCWLDRNWFDSGEGEKLAVVCRDPDATVQPAWLIAKLSRWGGDMTMRHPGEVRQPGQLQPDPTFLAPSQIVGMREVRAALPRPADAPPSAIAESRNVRLAVLEPQFHSGTGRWFCDIELSASAAFRVGVQLSLARYQENAIEGCHLSDAIKTDAFFLPQPWTFSAMRRGEEVEVSALGPAYTARAPMTMGLFGDPGLAETTRQSFDPLINVELERLVDGSDAPLIAIDAEGRPVTTSSRAPGTRVEIANGSNSLPAGWRRWTMRLNLPEGDTAADFAVRVSLSSAHANSQAAGQVSDDGALIYLPEPIVAQIVLGRR